MTLNKKEVTS
ncbi:hypothetical protein N7452_005505 [Penicillium brevicompactum]|uniref:Uncharacterized protein n=1 Tax=Penicillium brevicompactum TaxID=5074 RepID=A0A9W9QIS0_PENBR|nr:hypothetical protein N7452_005505 [Penicillium brevicompactum]